MTTNSTFLRDCTALARLERVNVSQNAIDPEAFAELTRFHQDGSLKLSTMEFLDQ